MLPTTAFPNPDDRGYEDDPMQVERGATPDGRLLLYFTFRKPDDEPHAPREGDGAVARSPHPRPLSLDAGEGSPGTPPRSLRERGLGGEGACDRTPDAEA
ncbi:MAG TPA: hypothetical protein VKF37_19530 [Chloroflexota bacterium]|nr:hypothetical protein [Chloroflexota bacterium]